VIKLADFLAKIALVVINGLLAAALIVLASFVFLRKRPQQKFSEIHSAE
jgi:hypothetical protein